MSAIMPFQDLFGFNVRLLTNQEKIYVEAILYQQVYKHWQLRYQTVHKKYFDLIKPSKEEKDIMLNKYFIQLAIQEIVGTHQYTLEGVARYTNTSIETIADICQDRYFAIPADFLYRLIELDYCIRGDFYEEMLQKLNVAMQNIFKPDKSAVKNGSLLHKF